MIKSVSFNDLSEIKTFEIISEISEKNNCYLTETKCIDGRCIDKLYFTQLIYVYFNYDIKIFNKFINKDIIIKNKHIYIDYFQEIINHFKNNNSYSFYRFHFKIKKKKKDLNKLQELYNYCIDLK